MMVLLRRAPEKKLKKKWKVVSSETGRVLTVLLL